MVWRRCSWGFRCRSLSSHSCGAVVASTPPNAKGRECSRPFVCALHADVRNTPTQVVAELRWVRLGELFHPETRVRTSVRVRDLQMKVDAYQLGDFTVWGMTERILATFEEIWR